MVDISAGTMVLGSTDYKKYTKDPEVKLNETGIYKIKSTAINEDGRKYSKVSGAYTVKRTFYNNATDCSNKAVTTTITSGWSEKKWKNGTFTINFKKGGKVGSYSVYVKTSNCKGKTSCGSSWTSEVIKINKASTNKSFTSVSGDSAKYIIKVIAYASNNDSSSSCTYTKIYKQDNDKPKCTTSYTAPSNYPSTSTYHNGWTNQNVTLKGSCSNDTGGSGCNTSTYTTQTFTTSMNENKAPAVSNKVKDNAGNVSTDCNKVLVKIDKIKPTCDKITKNNNTWTNSSTTLGVNCKDTGASNLQSGCKQTSFTKSISSEGLYETGFSVPVYDWAGNVNTNCSTGLKFTKKIDKTKPECDNNVTGASSWSKTSNTVKVGCSDKKGTNQGNSGCTSSTFSKTLSTEGEVEKSVTFTVKDNAGNSNSCTKNNVPKKVDKTPPDKNSIKCSEPTNSCGASTWHNNAYTITYSATDPQKGNTPGASGGVTFTLKSNNAGTQTGTAYNVKKKEGNYPITVVKVCDKVGNCTNVNQQKCSAKVDVTPPTSSVSCSTCSPNGSKYRGYIMFNARDNLSGPWQAKWQVCEGGSCRPTDFMQFNGTNYSDEAGGYCTDKTRVVEEGECICQKFNKDGECTKAKQTNLMEYYIKCSFSYTLTNYQDMACNKANNWGGSKGCTCDKPNSRFYKTKSCSY